MSSEETLNIRYRRGQNFSATIIARGIDSASISYILKAVQEGDFQYVKRLKESLNFECIVIDNDSETII